MVVRYHDSGSSGDLFPIAKADFVWKGEFSQSHECEETSEEHGHKEEVIVER